jgi:predicted MPP superfamily phosphohydrolase
MKLINYLAIAVVIIIFLLLNYYIGYKGTRFIKALKPGMNLTLYWALFWIVSLSYIISKISGDKLPENLNRPLDTIGSFWLGAMLYLLMALLILEIFKLIGRVSGLWVRYGVSDGTISIIFGIITIAAVGTVLSIGYWNADNPAVSTYQVNIDKKAGNLNGLNVVMVSDIHLGSAGHSGLLDKTVDKINSLNPDIVLFDGDVIDEKVEPFIRNNYAADFAKIKAKYGMYAVTGNHEYYGGDANKFIGLFRQAGVNVLMDESVKVADSFYLVGRVDRTAVRYTGTKRKTLDDIMQNVDKNLPVLVMDHQPGSLQEAEAAGADLQFSGHTHKGQLFPGNLITKRIYELDWGYMKKGNFQVIVSSGLGTWGPPFRTGSRSEIVNARITFGK